MQTEKYQYVFIRDTVTRMSEHVEVRNAENKGLSSLKDIKVA